MKFSGKIYFQIILKFTKKQGFTLSLEDTFFEKLPWTSRLRVKKMSFHHKLESIQYNACLAITGAIRGTSKEKLYQELDLESLQLRRWFRKLGTFYKIYKNESPQYLFKLIPEKSHAYATRNVDNIPCFNMRHNFFKNSFLLQSLNQTI